MSRPITSSTAVSRFAGLVLLLVLTFVATSCRFDGAYDLPLPGGKAVDADHAITITAEFTDALNVVPRTAVMVDDVPVGRSPRSTGSGGTPG